ncbi:MAG: DUF1223 domain-containing protein [Pseudomonadota bacterium]
MFAADTICCLPTWKTLRFDVRIFLSLTAFGFALFAAGNGIATAANIIHPKGVVELFTSQGCHSCPPADKVIGKLSKTNEILAISTHVDYWDYLGWKDNFASKANTQRQYEYARSLNETQVYTPQAVINGKTHLVGSRESGIIETIDRFDRSTQGLVVPIKVKIDNNSLSVAIEDHPKAKNATLYLMSMKSVKKVKIERGENTGKTLSYHNILQEMQPIGMVKPGGLEMQYPLEELKRSNSDCFAFILQTRTSGGYPSSIVGAVYLEDL